MKTSSKGETLPKRYGYLFFDADGTLYDFQEAEREAFSALLQHLDIPMTEELLARYKHHNERCWKEFEQGIITIDQVKTKRFETFFGALDWSFDPGRASRIFMDVLARKGILYPQSKHVLETLSQRGYRLFLASNGISAVQRGRLSASMMISSFDGIFISEELGVQKPDPRFFATMLEKTHLTQSREACLMIGDSLSSDIAGGIASSIDTVWIDDSEKSPPPTCTPTFRIAHLIDLLSLLPPLH